MIEVNGMAHVILTVSRYDVAKAFYSRLMPALGLQSCKPEHAGERFAQGRDGATPVPISERARREAR